MNVKTTCPNGIDIKVAVLESKVNEHGQKIDDAKIEMHNLNRKMDAVVWRFNTMIYGALASVIGFLAYTIIGAR